MPYIMRINTVCNEIQERKSFVKELNFNGNTINHKNRQLKVVFPLKKMELSIIFQFFNLMRVYVTYFY